MDKDTEQAAKLSEASRIIRKYGKQKLLLYQKYSTAGLPEIFWTQNMNAFHTQMNHVMENFDAKNKKLCMVVYDKDKEILSMEFIAAMMINMIATGYDIYRIDFMHLCSELMNNISMTLDKALQKYQGLEDCLIVTGINDFAQIDKYWSVFRSFINELMFGNKSLNIILSMNKTGMQEKYEDITNHNYWFNINITNGFGTK